MEQQSLEIRFGGVNHKIDSNTLVSMLVHYQEVVLEANRQMGDGSRKINIEVNALREGSFVIDLTLVSGFISSMFSSGVVAYLSNLITVVQGAFYLHSLFKGRPVKTLEDKGAIHLEDYSLNIQNLVVNVYNQPPVREAMSNVFRQAEADENVESVELSSCDSFKVNISRDQFADLIYDDFELEDESRDDRVSELEAKLVICRLSFDPNSTWSFIYNGQKISAQIKDSKFWEMIDNGAQFGKGDVISVILRKIEKFDPSLKTYVISKYKVLEYVDLIKAPKDRCLF